MAGFTRSSRSRAPSRYAHESPAPLRQATRHDAKIESVRAQLFKHPAIAAFTQKVPHGFAHADGSKLSLGRDLSVTPNHFTELAARWQRTTPYPNPSKTVAGNAIAEFRAKRIRDFIERGPGEFVNEHGVTVTLVEPQQLWTKFYKSPSRPR
ncbi:MAG: hypothetical protein K1X64_20310 [Myxococcaceae bacterium]|nr:hypothetical protein [Myxococcaceae bacterium]